MCVCQCPAQGCWYGKAVKMNRDARNKMSPIPFLLDDENFTVGVVQRREQQQQQQQQQQHNRHRQKQKHGHRHDEKHVVNDVLCLGHQETVWQRHVEIIIPLEFTLEGLDTPKL